MHVVIVLILLAIGLGIFLGLYFTGHTSVSDGVTQETPLSGPVELDYSMTIQQKFKDEYNDPNSTKYKELENMVLSTIDNMFMNSDMSSVYDGSEVRGFSNGSVVAKVFSRFKRALIHSTEKPSDLNKVLDVFVDEVKNLIEEFTSQPGCCNGLKFVTVIINGANIEPPSPPQPADPATNPPTAASNGPPAATATQPPTAAATQPPTAAATHPPTEASTVHSPNAASTGPPAAAATQPPTAAATQRPTAASSGPSTAASTDPPNACSPTSPTNLPPTAIPTYSPFDPPTSGCVLNSCLNNGTCQPIGRYGFNCECPDGFVGTRCEIEADLINLLENEEVEITSPSYPSNYQNNLDVQWIIQTAEDLGIFLSFHDFNTQSYNDYLEVGNGRDSTDSSTRVFRRSGSSPPPDTLSTGNAMWLRFTSDGYFTRRGFSLSARSIGSAGCILNSCLNNGTCQPVGRSDFYCECPAGFGGTRCESVSIFVGANETVEVISPGYPDRFPRELDAAIWIIQTDQDRKILVDFNDLTTEHPDYWKVGDGVVIDEFTFLLWGRIYLYRQLPNLLSNGSAIWISFSSSSYQTREGFSFLVSSVPPTESLTCSAAEFDCGHSVCLSSDLLCDRQADCIDGRDEETCGCDFISCQHNGTCVPSYYDYFNCRCSPGFEGRFCERAVFECEAFGYDFDESETCDGVLKCPNGDDERGCECGVYEYQCRNTICVSSADVECNGTAECLDYSDEGVNCNEAYCVEIDSDECLAILPYNTTYFPNDFAANNSINEYLPQLTTNCTDSERLALCMAFFPECPRFGSQRRVCASLCSRALECVGLDTDSTPLHCDVYPDQGVLSTSDGCLYDEEDIVQTGDCGRRPAASPSRNPFSRIIGGAPSHIANWPWIGSYRLSDGRHVCAATLISPRWAVTAAHCGQNHQLVFGSSLLDTPSDYPHAYRIAQFFIHPGYNNLRFHNDIALVKLATPVRYTDTIQPACLETGDDEADIYDTCHAVGWGRTSVFDSVSPVLKEARVPLVSWEQCKSMYSHLASSGASLTSDQICAGDADSTNETCRGDSGGPLICRGTNGRWKLVGITSTGLECGATTPGVFTRVSKYIDFIRHTIATAFQPCTADEFDCGDYVCIDGHSRCDHQDDCIDAIDEELCGCVLNSCLNNGTCQPIGRYGFNCECPAGFGGTRCEIEQNLINLLENESVEITSPSYPSNYQNNLNIQWIIQTAEDLGILLSFHAFNTQSYYDYLEVGNGRDSTDSSTRVIRRSGSSPPPDTFSTGNAMWLRFTSNGYSTRSGFSLSAQSIGSAGCILNSCLNNGTCQPVGRSGFYCECPVGFGGTRCESEQNLINLLENEEVEITSPSYPSNYQNNLNIQWIIQTAEDLGILLSFHAFNTQSYNDYLEVGNGRDSTDYFTRVFRLSGSSPPPDTLSTGNAMWLRFTSNGYSTESGFSLSAQSIGSAGCILNSCLNNGTCQPVGRSGFNCECPAGFGGTRCESVSIFVGANETVAVTSPGYPDRLPREDAAIWIIQTDQDRKILVDFNDLTTEYYDDWKVGDGVSIDVSTFLSWRGRYRQLPNLLSNGSAIWISLSFSSPYGTRGALSFDVASVQSTQTLTCSAAEFDCGHSVCINSVWRCDYYDDCHDGSDEECGCVSNSCLNNGTCQPIGRYGFNCECPAGIVGTRCEIVPNIINLLANESVEITSPSYPSHYQDNLDIRWIIQTAQDLRIRLSFHLFNTESDFDYLEVGNGRDSTDSSTRVFRRSGSSPPPPTLSTGNAMWLRFTSNGSVTKSGFSLSAQSVQPTGFSK
ncbi:uncharacterized protein LOC119724889 isoform X2 [Patiria miniata]|uniref:Enteropeptidase n=1 Tax=Patiria miniata TaxID=46514 RepID=A0A913ZM24_PATMI|nr:uncharacterized protein LOC119724889 isoform X2 [Patiria miniata]